LERKGAQDPRDASGAKFSRQRPAPMGQAGADQ
jgi:hypothetical protein